MALLGEVRHLAQNLVEFLLGSMEEHVDRVHLELEELGRLRLRTVVARRAGLLYRLASQQDKVMLVFSRKKITYPSEMEAALRYIATAAELEVGSIPNLDVVQRLLLVQRLVREGFLIVVRQPPQNEC